MVIKKIKDFVRGWIIGDFEPNIYKTKDFELGILTHKKNEIWPKHYHKIATEYNILISGSMKINNKNLEAGDIFVIEPYVVSEPVFNEDCVVVCLKIPSCVGDKYCLDE
jgi:quercetin dioxygenase-like cupin family protein